MSIIERFLRDTTSTTSITSTSYSFQKLLGDSSEKQIYRVFHNSNGNDTDGVKCKCSYILIKTPQTGPNSSEIFLPAGQTSPTQSQYLEHFMQELADRLPRVPQVIESNPTVGILIATDLGDQTLADYIELEGNDSIDVGKIKEHYQKAIDWLIAFQAQDYPDEDLIYQRQLDGSVLLLELEELLPVVGDFNKAERLKLLFKRLADRLNELPRSHVHRDYQSRNLMIFKTRCNESSEPYVIDVQDLCQGPYYYDLASLLYDQNAMLSPELRVELMMYYRDVRQRQHPDSYEFSMEDFRLVALQRILKAWARHAAIYAKSGRYASLERTKRSKQVLANLYLEQEDATAETDCWLVKQIIELLL